MKQNTTFTADDGTVFGTHAECKTYEKTIMFVKLLVGLTEDQIMAALNRTDIKLADAFERAGNIILASRLARGESRRGKKAGEKAMAGETARNG